tara:strand:+ start:3460 stop:4758 length:1299 start_codon:yes stop_codon:yes gene_type:complete
MYKNKLKNIKDLCEYIWYLEEKYDLFNLEINGIHPWAAFRMDIYYEIGKQLEIFDKNLNMKLSRKEKAINFFRLLKQSIINNPNSNLYKVDALVFSHTRSKVVDKKLIDPYTHYLTEDLIKDNISFLEFESPYNGKHLRKKKKHTRYLDSILIYRNIKNLFIKTKIDQKNKEVLEKLSNEINTKITHFLDIKKILISNSKKFIPTYSFYLKLLKRTKPKKIYVVVSYGKGELIKAANDLNIKIIELQHGTFSKYHLGYSFPGKSNKLYLPTKFYVWNKFWKKLINLSMPKSNIIIHPFKHIENEKQKYNYLKKKKNSLIVFGQGGITENIANKIINNISYFKRFNIIFKLHPNEYHMRTKYENLKHLEKMQNIKVVTNIDLYKELALSEFQAGVFSTVLYEGVEFNCKTILLELSGIEYMEKFIEQHKPIII